MFVSLGILKSIEANPVPTVAIGGIGAQNACELLEGSDTGKIHIDGLAIVSAIMAAEDPKDACEELLGLIRSSLSKMGVKSNNTVRDAVQFAVQAAKNIKEKTPMVHHITSKFCVCVCVVQDISEEGLLTTTLFRLCGDQR